MVMTNQIKFKIHSMRTLASPYKRTEKDESAEETIYYLLVNMKDLPEDIPLDVNPRVPKMGTNVAKRLVKAVTEPETDFYINNRGTVLSLKLQSILAIRRMKMISIVMGFSMAAIRIRRSYRTEIRSQVILKNMSVWKSLQML